MNLAICQMFSRSGVYPTRSFDLDKDSYINTNIHLVSHTMEANGFISYFAITDILFLAGELKTNKPKYCSWKSYCFTTSFSLSRCLILVCVPNSKLRTRLRNLKYKAKLRADKDIEECQLTLQQRQKLHQQHKMMLDFPYIACVVIES